MQADPPKAEFTPIRVATLRGDLKIPFDVYVRVAGKHILYCRNGASFEGLRLNRLRSKRLRKMYIRPEEEGAYQQYLEQSIDEAYNNKDKAISIRAEVIQGFQQAEAETYFEDPLDQFSYEHTRSSVQRFTEFIKSEQGAVKALLQIPNTDQSVSHHGVTVATLALSLAIKLNLREGLPLHLMALGALLHDIEHFFTDIELGRPVSEFSDEELRTYKQHPMRGAARLQQQSFIDPLVISIIVQHEEHCDGGGFPKGIFQKDMDPLVVVVAAANAYDRIVCFEKMAPKDALKHLLIEKLGVYPLDHLTTMQNILKEHGLV